MNVLDIDDTTLRDACYRTSQSLMWDARQETAPLDMLHEAGAAACAELYAGALENMVRNKALAGFELFMSESERAGLHERSLAEGLGPDLADRLRDYFSRLALEQSYTGMEDVFDSVKKGYPTPNFKAQIAETAEEVAEGNVTQRAVELLAEQKARVGSVGFDRDLIEKGLEQGVIQVEPEDDVDIRVSIGENWFWAKMPEELGPHANRRFSDFSGNEFADSVASTLADLAEDPDDYADELAYYDAYLRENVDFSDGERDMGASLMSEEEAMRGASGALAVGDVKAKSGVEER